MSRKPTPRLHSFDYTGYHRYFLTISTSQRARAFVSSDAVGIVLEHLVRTSESQWFAVIAYCFMPDHLHAVVEGVRDASDFQEFVRIFKQQSAFNWKRATGRTLWHRGYAERVLRSHDDTTIAIRYVIENPVRAGLVPAPEDYPYLGSMTGTVTDLLDSMRLDAARTDL